MRRKLAIQAAQIFDGHRVHADVGLLIDGDRVEGIVPQAEIPSAFQREDLDHGVVVPGFVDLQVNGGGGVLFNERTDVDAIRAICHAHLPFGTTSLLPTLITASPETTAQALTAGISAQDLRVPGFLGVHLEGPHLDTRRKGAHDASLIRTMTQQDADALIMAKSKLAHLLVTVAPASITKQQVIDLTVAGIRTSLGHTDASFEVATDMVNAGSSMVTHLYNAMSGLGHRDPGVVGAALESGGVYAGLIADGFHVDFGAIRIALRAKRGPGKLFLVTDAMSLLGTDQQSLTLNDRVIQRKDGKLTLADGTLAGTDLDMMTAIRNLIEHTDIEPWEAYRMASLYPATAIGADEIGHLTRGAQADFVHLDDAREIRSVWQRGVCEYR